jgi:pimeloyl-ACP methyl ester carboxylesterase
VPAERNPALGLAEAANRQIERATHFIREHHGVPKISIIAHSWGTIATGRFAGSCPDQVERLAFFGPVTWRQIRRSLRAFPPGVSSRSRINCFSQGFCGRIECIYACFDQG